MQITQIIKRVAVAALLAPALAWSAGAELVLDAAPVNQHDKASLQRGAALFSNYCLSCHGASSMRYNRMQQDLGLTKEQVEANLMFTDAKIGDTMQVAMSKADAKTYFGAPAPDLSVIARSNRPDWLYTYLRTFYQDDSRTTGYNNLVFPAVGMPHVLHELQGTQEMRTQDFGKDQAKAFEFMSTLKQPASQKKVVAHDVDDPSGAKGPDGKPLKVKHYSVEWLQLTAAGKLTQLDGDKANTEQFDRAVGDLVNFLVYMGEPAQLQRQALGSYVLFFLIFLLLPLVWLLKKSYWKDVH